ncbi:RNA polymerase subunit sigma-70 [Enterococcus silesiacus]|uniref:RNA polymerase subunit sigma-70 n=1 Tax=Enterococcus silesiacus TaxID=332949 RepID=A0A0S3K9T5_9ENTE|nr:sigma-70 family RNA polymerase sigma factor [Enterococcus silesiacus]ALS00994.1 RNA polymerase subunit sigma-70 [Enterococcus silesiacus]OJG91781.1 sigma-70 family RNA polymerase sigma factor [Enterococcus silesiacus]
MGKFSYLELSLIKKAIKGDKVALGKVLRKNHIYLYKMAYIYIGNKEDALDIMQEATIQSIKSIHTLKEPSYFLTWFCTIMARQASKLINQKIQIRELQNNPEFEEPTDLSKNKNQSIDVLDAVMSLEDKYRLVLQLFYYQDFSVKEISELLTMPEGTVKTNLKRGREALKTVLGEDYYV